MGEGHPPGSRTLWGGVVPLACQVLPQAQIARWAKAWRVRRVLLVCDAASGHARDRMVAELEALDLAVFLVDQRGASTVAAIGDGLGAYGFDQCDGVVGLGGARAIDAAKMIAFMTVQRRTPAELAAAPETIDPIGRAPCLAVATDCTGIGALGGGMLLVDDRGCPVFLRDAALRPHAAAYVPDLATPQAEQRGRAELVALTVDTLMAAGSETGEADPMAVRVARRLLDPSDTEVVQAALQAAGMLEATLGPARVLSSVAEVMTGVSPASALAALVPRLAAGNPELRALADGASARLPAPMDDAALATLPLEPLAFVTPEGLPVDMVSALDRLGREIPARRRRGGRGRRMG